MTDTAVGDIEQLARRHVDARQLPLGTVTFLFSDIEASTKLLIDLGEDYPAVVARHYEILRAAVGDAGGTTLSSAGDSLFVAFRSARAAVRCAVDAQLALAAEPWPQGRAVRVRIGVHTGEGFVGGDDYVGLDVHRTARISAAAHGGQIVVSAATAALLPTDDLSLSVTDLGVHRLKDLVNPEHLFQVSSPGLDTSFPPLRSAGGVLSMLPVPRTGFVARPEIDTLSRLLRRERLVTLTGPGGVGKTRLAIETARRAKDWFPDGVVFVSLAALSDPQAVPMAVLETMGLQSSAAAPAEQLCRQLRSRAALLILDNFEHVLPAAEAVSQLLAASTSIRVLVTSRAPLRLVEEQELPIPPLDVPAPGLDGDLAALTANAAVQLFVQRAARVRPDFTLTPENAAAVAAIVAHVDGLPLAVELAAARVRLLTPTAIAQRLAAHGSGELASRQRDTPERHRSLRSVIAWSYDQLDETAQAAFRQFSVFRGGADPEQIEQVLATGPGGDALAQLEALVEQSLVVSTEVDGHVRYRMLTTISEYASELLHGSGEAGPVRSRHAAAFLALAEQAAPHLAGWEQRRWLDRLDRDSDNMRAALDHCVSAGEADHALRLCGALWRHWRVHLHLDDAAARIGAALRLPGGTTPARVDALTAELAIAWWRGESEVAQRAARERLRLALTTADPVLVADAHYDLGLVLIRTDSAQATREFQLALEAPDSPAGREVAAWATWGLAEVGATTDDWPAAAGFGEEALRRFRDPDGASSDANHPVLPGLNRAVPLGIGWSLFITALAHAHMADGDLPLARRRYQEAARMFARLRDLPTVTLLCWGMARIEATDNRLARAYRLVGAGRALERRTGARLVDFDERRLTGLGGGTTLWDADDLAPGEAERLVAEGTRFGDDEVIAYLLEEWDVAVAAEPDG